MVQRTSNVTRIMDKLMEKELVKRDDCPTNRRKMDNILTETGEKLLNQLDKKVYQLHAPMADNLTSDEANTLTKLIKKLKGEN